MVHQDQISFDQWDTDISRSGFLRRMGKTLAIGLGVALLPVGTAKAAGARCCPNPDCGTCIGTNVAYSCTDGCSGKTCCIGCRANTGCFNEACGACQ